MSIERVLASSVFALLILTSGAVASDLVIQNARLVDGTGAPPRESVSILIRDGVIREVAADVGIPEGARVLDASGGTVIPGLIDCHVHLGSVPGSALRNDSAAIKRSLRELHLRAYLANGVTTVLDTGISFEHLAEIRQWLASGLPGPRVYALGPPLSAPGGYSDDRPPSYHFGFSVRDAKDADRRIEQLVRADAVGVKVKIEDGLGPVAVWPIHRPEIRDAIVAAGRAHGLPLFIHAMSEYEQQIALDMKPYAFVHGGFMNGEPSDEHVRRLAESGTWVISTLSVADAARIRTQPEFLDALHVVRSVPEIERETARDPAMAQAYLLRAARASAPEWWPPWVIDWIVETFPSITQVSSEPSAAAIARFHAAGVPIVMGSDSGNWESIPYEFHGPTSVREVELLAQAGLTTAQAIEASTRMAAEMLRASDEIGTVEVGKRADLVILREDPLKDLSALTRPRWVVKDGEARTPEDWMRQ